MYISHFFPFSLDKYISTRTGLSTLWNEYMCQYLSMYPIPILVQSIARRPLGRVYMPYMYTGIQYAEHAVMLPIYKCMETTSACKIDSRVTYYQLFR